NATQRNTKREVHKSNRESGNATKPTKGERLKMMNERLDQQIVTKKKVKSILNEGQYEKWEKSLKHRAEKKGKLREGKKSGKREKMNQ
ncbi:MAG: protein CpxP, partial [Flavobacteriales bacterium]